MKRIFAVISIAIASAGAQAQHVSDNSLFFLPTAYTMEQGTHQISSFELLFLQYSYALTPSTHFSAFNMFPITANAVRNSLSIGENTGDMLFIPVVRGTYEF